MSLSDEIARYIKLGFSIKGIQLATGNPSRERIIDIMREVDPYMYSILGDTKKLEEYRDKLFNDNYGK